MTSDERAKELREALKRAKRMGPGRPYPEALRRAALEYQKERENEGVSARRIAAELGVEKGTLSHWSRARKPSDGAFRAIEVVAEPVRETSRMVVHGPRGLRIEGLTLEELVSLLARLS